MRKLFLFFTVIFTIYVGLMIPSYSYFEGSPYQQLENDILPEDVICKEGLELIFKISNGNPTCISLKIAERLFERSWGTIENIEDAIKIENTDLVINYKIEGGVISQIRHEQDFSLIVDIVSNSNGTLIIKIPYKVGEKLIPYRITGFVVLEDGLEPDWNVQEIGSERMFTIPFTQSTKEIKIVWVLYI